MKISFKLTNKDSELTKLHANLVKLEKRWSLPVKTVNEMNLILDELVSNIVEHGGCENICTIGIELMKEDTVITLRVTDNGPSFDPTITPAPDISLPIEERPCGGLGIHLVRKFSDGCSYKRENNLNVLTLIKKLPTECR